MANLIWHVAAQPKLHTETWEWPMAMYAGPLRKHAAYIISREPCSERGMNNGPLIYQLQVIILNYTGGQAPRRMISKNNFFTRVESAIAFTQLHLERHKEWQPLIV